MTNTDASGEDFVVVLKAGEDERRLSHGQSILVGRDGACDWEIDHREISRKHVRIGAASDGVYVADLDSSNGTTVDGVAVHEWLVAYPDSAMIVLGSSVDAVTIELTVERAGSLVQNSPLADDLLATRMVDASHSKITVGRDPGSTVWLEDPLVSRSHCQIERTSAGLRIVDLASRNGTYVNGSLVRQQFLHEGDVVTVGNTDIEVHAANEIVVRSDATRSGLVIRDLSYATPEGKILISDINLHSPPGAVIGVIGPSGAGKSTLMNAITGLRSPKSGSVEFDGHDVHREYEAMKSRIGFVPQDDLIHRQLTVRQAFEYAARLRLPADTEPTEIESRVGGVIDTLGLALHQHTPIKKLSGGQRKRASIGLELLTEPALLVLDEPTSGLDPNTARDLMATLRELAGGGRTVVVVSHSPADLDQCDLVVLLAAGGLLAGLASPNQLLAEFSTDDWRDIYREVSTEGGDPQRAASRYRTTAPSSTVSNPPRRRRPHEVSSEAGNTVQRPKQVWTLIQRQTRLLLADRGYLVFLALLPIALGVLALIVPGSDGFLPSAGLGTPGNAGSKEASQLLVVVICGAAFSGLALSIRDLVSERSIYERERAVGLRPRAYISSKVAVFGVAGLLQALVLTLVVLSRKPAPLDPLVLGNGALEFAFVVILTLWSSCALGLFLSSVVRSNEQVMPVLVLTIMAQLVFCGGLIQITDRLVLTQLSWIFPSRWGYSAAASTIDVHALAPMTAWDAQWEHLASQWFKSVGALVVLAFVFVGLAAWRVSERRQGAVNKPKSSRSMLNRSNRVKESV